MVYYNPDSIEKAAELIESTGGMIIAGGTDLCVQIAEGLYSPDTLIDITGIASMAEIRLPESGGKDSAISIGGAATIADIADHADLPVCLRQGARAIGSPQIRNMGTMGGNVCNASPCGDTLAPLLCLDAVFVLVSSEGTRRVLSKDFFTGPKQTVRNPSEILEKIEIPVNEQRTFSAFRMIGKRNGQVISQVNAAVCLTMEEGMITHARAAVGSVAPVPLRLPGLEEFLPGKQAGTVTLAGISPAVQEDISPITDVRTTEKYRRRVAVSLLMDALVDCAGQYAEAAEGGSR